ncbi:glycoside hydrolase family 95 protein [Aaosphaeria arxii CBS 175.79]|uniref:Glycoside hydrolase family 95 protein n=1 Tax=Aaosphaeria arxii CBS 175.79 TaxID=1450172 RepID=A0A6A5XM19_9PLEO|nr:glycoside hydrolase family 95 protein [Aaosphaeria arxii CBS 175.79]KAF2013956.1 glycoside hydrolase family 95 protein [Aaosphaeria arxii CBS 175.79]
MLHYTHPASDWNHALPIGNGRLGAMVYGGIYNEILRLNEESVWYGGPQTRTPANAKHHLQELRKLIREGKHQATEALVRKRFLATPKSSRHYEPLGTCKIDFDYDSIEGSIANGLRDKQTASQDFERTLDLENAEATVRYKVNGVLVKRECIATFPDKALVIRIRAEKPISFIVSLTRMSDVDWEVNEFLDSVNPADGRIVMHATPGGRGSNSLCVAAGARIESGDGSVKIVGQSLEIVSTDALVVLAARTQYRHPDVEKAALADIDAAFGFTAQELWHRHSSDWKSKYDRMSVQLYPDAVSLPTEDRLKGVPDPGLLSLYHSYSRYLLLSSSRSYPGALPATLQGIWNPSFQPAWGSKYTININLQMNYWIANVSNLSDCELPVFELLERMAVNGRRTAEEVWNCRGWCAHHCTDIFADTEPQDAWMPATLWPLGGAWMCTHIWEHYEFTHDEDVVKRMMPVLEGCVRFLLDFLVPDSTGEYLVTNPSLSPENTFRHPTSGENGVFCEGSVIDIEIVRTVFQHYLLASNAIPGMVFDAEIASQVRTALLKLPPMIISPTTGTIQEWGLHDYAETEPGHRHVSQLYGLHPGSSITPSSTPKLADAAIKTLTRRLQHGGGHTGWSRAWLVNMWARLRQPEQCERNLHALLRDSTLPNMLDTHPPFQIDGNFGGGAGIMECLVQSHETFTNTSGAVQRIIRLLPACPASWAKGIIRGAQCRGGFELDFSWDSGNITEPIILNSKFGTDAVLIVRAVGADAQHAGIHVKIPARVSVHVLSLSAAENVKSPLAL